MRKLARMMALALGLLMMITARAEKQEGVDLPNIPAASAERLAEAANVPGGALTFANPADAGVWPMIPAEEEGQFCLMSTNGGRALSESAVHTTVEAAAGDALAFTFKTDTEAFCDLLELRVNGETVKTFSGARDWTRFAWAFPEAGAYEIAFAYVKDDATNVGADAVYLAEIAHLTGDEAAAAIAANPIYPFAAQTTLTVATPGARRIAFEDPTFALTGLFGFAEYWIVPEGEAQVLATLAAGSDPEAASFQTNYSAGDQQPSGVTAQVTEAGYAFNSPIDTLNTTGYAYTQINLYPAKDSSLLDVKSVVCFVGADGADAFAQWLRGMGYGVAGWEYADGEDVEAEDGEEGSWYGLTFIDQQGEFLPGVTVTVTAENYAEMLTSDEEGGIVFTAPAQSYEVRIVLAPEDYAFDPEQVWTLDAEGGDAIIDLVRGGE